MKKILYILVPVVAVVGFITWYFFSWPSSPVAPSLGNPPATASSSHSGNPPLPANLPPPVSTTAGNISGAQGVLVGNAKPIPGAILDLTRVKLAIYDPNTNKELKSIFLGADGSYLFSVTAGEYILNLVKGYGLSKNLPQRIYVGSGETIRLNFQIAN